MTHSRAFAMLAVCVLALGGGGVLHGQVVGFEGATYLSTVYDFNTDLFSSRSLITLHPDHSFEAVDSGQGGHEGGHGIKFSSQLGHWETARFGMIARALDFSFPSAGIGRWDYELHFGDAQQESVSGIVTLTIFGLRDDPLGTTGGTLAGSFYFRGTRVTLPLP